MAQKLAKVGARPVGSSSRIAARVRAKLALHRFPQTGVLPLGTSLLYVGLVTAALLLLDQRRALSLAPISYLIPVIIAATQWGIWPATLASIASTGAIDFFFTTPRYSFWMDDPQEVVDLLLFLTVALVSGNLASRLRRKTETLRQREKEIAYLYEFSRLLAACFTISDLISAIQNYLSRTLGQQAVFFAATADGRFEPPESGSVPSFVQESVGSMTATIGTPSHTIIDNSTQNIWLLRTVCSETAVHGLVAVNIGHGSHPKRAASRPCLKKYL